MIAKDKINLCLDCADVDPQQLVAAIKAGHMEQQVVVRGGRDHLQRVHSLSSGTIATMPPWQTQDGLSTWLDEMQPAIVEIDIEQTSSDGCREFHARGIQVLAAARGQSDKAQFWDKALADGADCIKTDLPEELVVHVLSGRMKSRPVRFACHRGASRYAPRTRWPHLTRRIGWGPTSSSSTFVQRVRANTICCTTAGSIARRI